jgi:hypothetical protein
MPRHPAPAGLLCAVLLGACTPPAPDIVGDASHSARAAYAAMLAAVTPGGFGADSRYGTVVNIESVWRLPAGEPAVCTAAGPVSGGLPGFGRHRIHVLLESGDVHVFPRAALGGLRVGDEVRLYGGTLLHLAQRFRSSSRLCPARSLPCPIRHRIVDEKTDPEGSVPAARCAMRRGVARAAFSGA